MNKKQRKPGDPDLRVSSSIQYGFNCGQASSAFGGFPPVGGEGTPFLARMETRRGGAYFIEGREQLLLPLPLCFLLAEFQRDSLFFRAFQKKKTVERIGIHKFLRLVGIRKAHLKVPVFEGDDSAFSENGMGYFGPNQTHDIPPFSADSCRL
ncbi:MAG: hypothetical protein PHY64_01245 [Eubacteriales bacterium]|nr:hypothetical protein [Eubacteriales bacterium]